ncbi:MAG: LysM peptidoglycan-binding domain-containing protein [Actinomycetota bacterium]
MTQRRSSRLAALGGPVVVAALVLAACGGSDSAAPSRSTIALDSSTAFVTIPPATAPPTTLVPVPGDVVETEQTYVVQSGDWPLRVADLFGVSLQDLVSYNGWVSEQEFPFPGTEIKIPPGGKTPESTGGGTGDDGVESVTGGESEQAGDTIPEAGDNCQPGSYVIEAGDLPGRVAEKFDVTLDALNQANTATNGYTNFVVGITIVIPAKADCVGDESADE